MSATPPLAHRIEGDGPPVVLLNGGLMSSSAWEPIAAPLARTHRVLRFDFRGQLQSPGPPPPTLAGHAADVETLLDGVGWESAHLVGTSFGAQVAIELAARTPGRARSLLLATAMDRATPEFRRQTAATREALLRVLAGGDPGSFYDHVAAGSYSDAYRRREADALATRRLQVSSLPRAWFEGALALIDAVDDFDQVSRLGSIRAPALVVLTRGDRLMDPVRSRALAAALDADVVEHPTSGHALVIEDSRWLARVCLDFLARQGRESEETTA